MGLERRLEIAAVVGLAMACGRSAPPPSSTGGGATALAAGTARAATSTGPRVCTPADARCADDATAEVCSADGQRYERVACGVGALCLEGRCVALAVPPPTPGAPARPGPAGALDPRRLQALRGDGWLNAWGAAGPLPAGAIAAYVPAAGGAAGTGAVEAVGPWMPRCEAGGFVTALPRAEPQGTQPRYALLGGYLVSGKRRRVALLAGIRGGARVLVNDALAAAVSRPGGEAPFKDETIADIELQEGVNPVLVVAEQQDQAPAGLWLRVRDPDGRALPDLLFAPAVAEGCPIAELLQIRSTPRPVQGGFSVEISARLPGVAPRQPADLAYRAELRGEGGEAPREIAAGRLEARDLAGAGAATELPASPPKAGKYEIALWIGEGEAPARIPLVFRGDLHDRIVALEAQLAGVEASGVPAGSKASFAHHVRTLARALAAGQPDASWLRARTADAEKIAAALARGEDPYRAKTGVVFRAYRSKLDGELSPYPVFIPPSYRPDGPALPLVIAFHGLDNPPEIALRTVIGEAPDKDTDRAWAARHLPAFPDQRAILAAPSGYGNAGQRPLGEHDVLAVIDEVKAHYRIDPRRISITGYSMGGTVAFVVPLHYPDLFSASAPLCGYPNLKSWDSVRGVRHAPWEDRLIEQRAIVNYVENGLHLPLHVVHGGLDGPERSRVIVDRYRELGYRVDFDLQEELDHNVWDHGYEEGRMITWLTARRRPEAPARVRLVTGELRYASSYWVRLLATREPPGDDAKRFAEIDARWVKAEGKVEVTTRGVGALALDLGAMGARGAVRAVVDGRELALPEAPAVAYLVATDGGGWATAAEEPPSAGKKRPGVSGPLDDIQRHPQLIVYGTQDAAQTEANRQVAEHFASYDTWAAARFPVKPDAEVGEEDLRGRSLVLIGGPASNRTTALFAAELPVRFEPGAIVLRGKRHEGDGVGVSLIYPHPRDPAEYVVLHAGVGFRGTLYSRHLPRLAPDYLVYDARLTVQKSGNLLDRRVALDGGFFDDAWR